MSKKILLLIPSLFLSIFIFGQQPVIMSQYGTGISQIRLISSNEEETVLEFTLGTVYSKQMQNGELVLSLDKGAQIQQKNMPDLPKFSSSIIIPDLADMEFEILEDVFNEITISGIAPSKGVISRNIDPNSINRIYGQCYTTNQLFPTSAIDLSTPYIMRDYRAQTINFYPLQYNPVTHNLIVHNKIVVKIKVKDDNGINPLYRNEVINSVEKEFHEMYSGTFLNYEDNSRYTAVEENGTMLIICHPSFTDEMQPFIDWKIQRGLPVEMVTTSTSGTTSSSIKSYVQNYYSTHPNLKYLLLVGDAAQIPPQAPDGSNGLAGHSDNFYGYLAGNDRYPEIFVGRFSAENIGHVRTQVQRSIQYEKNPGITNSFGKGITIGSAEGPGDDGEMDFEHERIIRNKLLSFTYTEVDEFYDGSQGGVDAPGDPTPSMLVNALNDGRGIITYTGHGWDGGCATSGLSSTDIQGLNNSGMLPFFWSVACVNGEFMNTTCFAEYCLRSTHTSTGEPVGMVATLMSTINQYWNEPMEGQDEMVDILTEAHTSNIKRTFGGISMNGCMKMNDTYGGSGMDMTDTWTCFGDPSLLVRTKVSENMTTTHINASPVGISNLTINCNIEDALISLSMNGQILGTGIISGGSVTINFPAINQEDTITVTATAFNHTPYQGIVEIVNSFAGTDEVIPSEVQIYPNPVSDVLIVQLNNNDETDFYYTVSDISGRIIYSHAPNKITDNYIQTIDVSSWSNGLYVLNTYMKESSSSYRFIVNH